MKNGPESACKRALPGTKSWAFSSQGLRSELTASARFTAALSSKTESKGASEPVISAKVCDSIRRFECCPVQVDPLPGAAEHLSSHAQGPGSQRSATAAAMSAPLFSL